MRRGSRTSARRRSSGGATAGRSTRRSCGRAGGGGGGRRTAERCRELPADLIRERTGLVPDPYFSATKLEWLVAPGAGDGLFGTVESWLAWNLTGGAAHVTDASNASRTLLARLDPVEWDPELLDLFGVPAGV